MTDPRTQPEAAPSPAVPALEALGGERGEGDLGDGRAVRVEFGLLFKVLESLRLAHIYALKDSHPEELPDDFKPHKWDGYEVEFAEESVQNYRALLAAMEVASTTTPDGVSKEVTPFAGWVTDNEISE